MKTTLKFFLFLALFSAVSAISTAQTPIPLTGNGIGDPDPLSGGHNKAPMQPPSLFIDGNSLYLIEDYSAVIRIFAGDDTAMSCVLYATSIGENEHSVLLATSLTGYYMIEIIVNNHSFIGIVYIE
jgi:hypothetical protein